MMTAQRRTRPLSVLVVDDNANDVSLAKRGFAQIDPNCSVAVVFDGQQAIWFLRELQEDARTALDLVLLDVNLPRYDGFQVLRVIRTELALRTPVIMFSASTNANDHKTALDLAANEFVVKPMQVDDVFSALAGIVSRWCPDNASSRP